MKKVIIMFMFVGSMLIAGEVVRDMEIIQARFQIVQNNISKAIANQNVAKIKAQKKELLEIKKLMLHVANDHKLSKLELSVVIPMIEANQMLIDEIDSL